MSPVRTAPATLAADDGARRAAYLDEVLQLLYPAPCEAGGTVGDTVAEYLIVPDARRPRLLVPVGSRRIAAAAVRRYAEPQTRLGRFKRDAIVAALRTGVSTVLLRDRVRITSRTGAPRTIEAYLREVLGTDVIVSVHIGPARPHRKPVLQLLTPAGTTLGFAKLGTGPVTRRLVRAETAALTALAHVGLRHLTVPRVLHAGQWHGHQVLVQQALPSWRPRAPLVEPRLVAAMHEVALSCGVTRGWLTTSRYWAELRDRLAALAAHPEGRRLDAVAQAVQARGGGTRLRFGAWHGDWAPGNMACLADDLLVWGWERFTPDVPLGFDVLHHDLHRRLSSTPDAAVAAGLTLGAAPELLAPFDVEPAVASLTGLLYLVDVATRHVTDGPADAGPRWSTLGGWLLPILTRRVEAL